MLMREECLQCSDSKQFQRVGWYRLLNNAFSFYTKRIFVRNVTISGIFISIEKDISIFV